MAALEFGQVVFTKDGAKKGRVMATWGMWAERIRVRWEDGTESDTHEDGVRRGPRPSRHERESFAAEVGAKL